MSIPTTAWHWSGSCVCGHPWSTHNAANMGCVRCLCGRGPSLGQPVHQHVTNGTIVTNGTNPPAKLTTEQVEACYLGRLVMVERVNPTNEHSAYQDGQYLVITATSSQLMGISILGNGVSSHDGLSVYGLGHRFRGLSLVGRAAYRVISIDEPGEWVDRQLNLAEAEISDVREGRRKAAWIMSVYDKAEAAIPVIRKALNVARREVRIARAADAADAILVDAVLTASAKTAEDKRAADRAAARTASTEAAAALWCLFEAYLKAGFTRQEAMGLLTTSMTVSATNVAPKK